MKYANVYGNGKEQWQGQWMEEVQSSGLIQSVRNSTHNKPLYRIRVKVKSNV